MKRGDTDELISSEFYSVVIQSCWIFCEGASVFWIYLNILGGKLREKGVGNKINEIGLEYEQR